MTQDRPSLHDKRKKRNEVRMSEDLDITGGEIIKDDGVARKRVSFKGERPTVTKGDHLHLTIISEKEE